MSADNYIAIYEDPDGKWRGYMAFASDDRVNRDGHPEFVADTEADAWRKASEVCTEYAPRLYSLPKEVTEAKPMTAERLADIEARVAKASPGPWRWGCGDSSVLYEDGIVSEEGRNIFVNCGRCGGDPEPEDQAFLSHARTDIPDLLSELRRVGAVEGRVKQYLLELVGDHMGVGDDPVGFLIASHVAIRHERDQTVKICNEIREQYRTAVMPRLDELVDENRRLRRAYEMAKNGEGSFAGGGIEESAPSAAGAAGKQVERLGEL